MDKEMEREHRAEKKTNTQIPTIRQKDDSDSGSVLTSLSLSLSKSMSACHFVHPSNASLSTENWTPINLGYQSQSRFQSHPISHPPLPSLSLSLSLSSFVQSFSPFQKSFLFSVLT